MGYAIEGGVQREDPGEGVAANLEYTLQLLAAKAEDQIDHFLPPGFPLAADEMALDFDNWSKAIGAYRQLTEDQSERLRTLDQLLDRMSGKAHPELWTHQALYDAPQWNEVRSLARAALKSFGWDERLPPREVYVEGLTERS